MMATHHPRRTHPNSLARATTHPNPFSASLQKRPTTLLLAVLLTGTLSSVLGMQTQVYQNGNGAHCEHCSTAHQYDNTVTYNKHSTGSPGTTYYTTEQRVVTSTNGAGRPVVTTTSSDYSTSGSNTGTSLNNQVAYEGSGNQTNSAHLPLSSSVVLCPPAPLGTPRIIITTTEICLSI